MKRLIAFFLAAAMCFLFCACGSDDNGESTIDYDSLDTFKIGVIEGEAEMQGDVFDSMYSRIGKKGYRMEYVEFKSADEAHAALAAKEIDVSLCSEKHEFADFEKENPDVLLNLGPVYYEPYGLYLCNYEKVDDIKDGCKVAVPSDEEGMARALLLLEKLGYIGVDDNAGITPTLDDIEKNDRSFEFVAVSADKIADNIESGEADILVMSSYSARESEYKINRYAMAIEDYMDAAVLDHHTLLLINKEEISGEKYKAVSTLFFSPMMFDYLEDSYGSYILPAFAIGYKG